MKQRYRVSRVYAIQMAWVVEAESEEEALKTLDDDDITPSYEASETWLGAVQGMALGELEDQAEVQA